MFLTSGSWTFTYQNLIARKQNTNSNVSYNRIVLFLSKQALRPVIMQVYFEQSQSSHDSEALVYKNLQETITFQCEAGRKYVARDKSSKL